MSENNSSVLEREVQNAAAQETAAAPDKKKQKNDGLTPEQRKKLRLWKIIAAVELVVVLLLVGARWVIPGWWITWDTGVTQTEKKDPTRNDFVPPEFDTNARDGVPTVSSELGWSALSVQDGYNIHVCGVLKTDSSLSLPVWFASDEGNTVWVKLRIVDSNGTTLGETGLLKAGQYVERVQLKEGAASGDVTLQIMGYQPGNYYSAGTVGLATTLTVS